MENLTIYLFFKILINGLSLCTVRDTFAKYLDKMELRFIYYHGVSNKCNQKKTILDRIMIQKINFPPDKIIGNSRVYCPRTCPRPQLCPLNMFLVGCGLGCAL